MGSLCSGLLECGRSLAVGPTGFVVASGRNQQPHAEARGSSDSFAQSTLVGWDRRPRMVPPFCTSSSGYGHKSATHLLDAEEVPAQGFGMSELIEPQQLLERIGLISETALAAMIGVGIKEESVRE